MNKLATRLIIAFVLIAVSVVGITALAINRAVDDNFRSYLQRSDTIEFNQNLIDRLIGFYEDNGTWEGVKEIMPWGSQRGQGAQLFVTDSAYVIVAATEADRVGQLLEVDYRKNAVPLVSQDQTVGYFNRVSPANETLALTEQAFLDDIRQTLVYISVSASGFGILLGIGLAWLIARPLRKLVAAMQSVADGRVGTHVTVQGVTEIQDMAVSFNQMSRTLAASETARQQMIADIAHELRTPLSVLRGQLEGMMDGVFATGTAHVGVAYNQTLYLARLINDLWTLARAEARSLPLQYTSLDIVALTRETTQDFQALAVDGELTLSFEADGDQVMIRADRGRVRQILANLISNAIRHTPAGGAVAVSLEHHAQQVVVTVTDTGEGLSPEVLQHVFERFYRADKTRHRDTGGAGLGLAIALELARLHEGDLIASSQAGRGSQFKLILPL